MNPLPKPKKGLYRKDSFYRKDKFLLTTVPFDEEAGVRNERLKQGHGSSRDVNGRVDSRQPIEKQFTTVSAHQNSRPTSRDSATATFRRAASSGI